MMGNGTQPLQGGPGLEGQHPGDAQETVKGCVTQAVEKSQEMLKEEEESATQKKYSEDVGALNVNRSIATLAQFRQLAGPRRELHGDWGRQRGRFLCPT